MDLFCKSKSRIYYVHILPGLLDYKSSWSDVCQLCSVSPVNSPSQMLTNHAKQTVVIRNNGPSLIPDLAYRWSFLAHWIICFQTVSICRFTISTSVYRFSNYLFLKNAEIFYGKKFQKMDSFERESRKRGAHSHRHRYVLILFNNFFDVW